MSFIRRSSPLVFLAVVIAGPVHAFSPQNVVITPTTFDFGWCPDNAKISAEFVIKNTGADLIPITSVQPTCGCTASQFTPGSLATNEETKVGLTFNTRGYAGTGFTKTAKVKTDAGGAEYDVQLKGVVVDPQAKIVPDQDGVVEFIPGDHEKKKTINVQNKSGKDITLEIIHQPASWVTLKMATNSVRAGASLPLEIALGSSVDETKDTSVTFEAKGEAGTSRLTIAIRSGTPPPTAPAAGGARPIPGASAFQPRRKIKSARRSFSPFLLSRWRCRREFYANLRRMELPGPGAGPLPPRRPKTPIK